MRFDTNGISSSAIQPERDGYETTTLHGKAYFAVTDQFSLKAVVRHADNEVEIDVQDFAFPSTPTQGLIVDSNDRQPVPKQAVDHRVIVSVRKRASTSGS